MRYPKNLSIYLDTVCNKQCWYCLYEGRDDLPSEFNIGNLDKLTKAIEKARKSIAPESARLLEEMKQKIDIEKAKIIMETRKEALEMKTEAVKLLAEAMGKSSATNKDTGQKVTGKRPKQAGDQAPRK